MTADALTERFERLRERSNGVSGTPDTTSPCPTCSTPSEVEPDGIHIFCDECRAVHDLRHRPPLALVPDLPRRRDLE